MTRSRSQRPRLSRRMLPLVLLGLVVAGCRSPAPHPFPIGIYAPGGAGNLPRLAEAGFDVVAGPASRPFFDAAHAARIRVLAVPGSAAGPAFDSRAARTAVANVGNHPALWAWYLADEPDLHGISASDVRRVQSAVRRAGSLRPTAVTTWHGTALARFAGTDILMVDHYPVGLGPIAAFFKEVRSGRAVADAARRKFVPVLQAMDWSVYPPEIRGLAGGEPAGSAASRAPSLAEFRCMAWGARVLGADGLFFYCYDDGRWRMPEHPGTWQDLVRVVREIRDLEPLFLARQPRVPVGLEWFEPGRRLNEALESSVLATLLEVDRGNGTVKPGRYVVLVNTTAEDHLVRLGRADWRGVEVPWLGTGKSVHLGDGQWLDPLPPYGVMILGPLPAELPLEPAAE
ncbi:MAG: hypothetical protein DVB31_14200 [Verrucomicrobia bacterium]|nr:MAG: hypothetical protein DVB31_14200 [Verrucomicrobiota bacterium]